MTCFPTWAETIWMNISQFGALLPFDMETVLRARGADLRVCTMETKDDLNQVLVVDARQRMVTGAFASLAKRVAQEMLKVQVVAGSTTA